MLTKNLKTQWLAELRNPNNTQCTHKFFGIPLRYGGPLYLEMIIKDPDSVTCMCALGCLVKVAAIEYNKKTGKELHKYHGEIIDDLVGPDTRGQIVRMNDDKGKPFAEIADWVEQNVVANDE